MLDAEQIRAALGDLARRLNEAGVAAGIRLVGGAALAVEYYERVATRDIDALLHPAEEVKIHAMAIARERGWPDDWLNDDVLMFMSHHDVDSDWKVLFAEGGVTVQVASAELLLAMKLLAGRGRRDSNDIDALLTACGVARMEEVEQIFDRFYPHEEMAERARRQIEVWLEEQS